MIQLEKSPRWNEQIEEKLQHFPIHVQCNEQSPGTTWHLQPGVEIHLTHEGQAVFIANGETLLQKSRQVIIHNGLVPHRFVTAANPSYRRSVLCVLPLITQNNNENPWQAFLNLESLLLDRYQQYHLDATEYARISGIFLQIEKELREKNVGWQQLALSCFLEMIVLLRRLAPATAEVPTLAQTSDLVQECIRYVLAHLGDDLSLKKMARLFAISEEHLIRAFQKELGISFHQFVIASRIDKSRGLLKNAPELTILQIALECGFSSASHFSRTFRQLIGSTPSQYREWTTT